MLLRVQYHVNTNRGALVVGTVLVCCSGCSTMMILVLAFSGSEQSTLLLAQYHVNTSGGAVAGGKVWVSCCGCSTMLILALAL